MQTIKISWKTVLVASIITGALVFIVSIFLPAYYSSEVSLLVIQKQPTDKVDAFSAAKSAEYLSDILSKAVYTDTFFADVMSSPYKIAKVFSSDHEERKIEWGKEVDTKKINNTGIIKITVYDPSKAEAQKLANAIAWNFATNGQKYHGGGDKVEIRLIDGPITSKLPAKPNIFLNALVGIIIGLIASIAWKYFFSAQFKSASEKINKEENQENPLEFTEEKTENIEEEIEPEESSEFVYKEPSSEEVRERLNNLIRGKF